MLNMQYLIIIMIVVITKLYTDFVTSRF